MGLGRVDTYERTSSHIIDLTEVPRPRHILVLFLSKKHVQLEKVGASEVKSMRNFRLVHPPGVEPGARPWEDPMLPLHHECLTRKGSVDIHTLIDPSVEPAFPVPAALRSLKAQR